MLPSSASIIAAKAVNDFIEHDSDSGSAGGWLGFDLAG
jgi:hypothetical protein